MKSERTNNPSQGMFLRSQTLENIPRDLVVRRTADLEEIAEVRTESARQQKRKTKANVN